TGRLFWDRPRNFEQRLDDEDDTSGGIPSPSFRNTPTGGHLTLTDLACTRPAFTAVLWWNRVSKLEPSGIEVGTLPWPAHYLQNRSGFESKDSNLSADLSDAKLRRAWRALIMNQLVATGGFTTRGDI
ncbi:hypothetical protein AVEN_202045-1, partial [Araneus ventricosus]